MQGLLKSAESRGVVLDCDSAGGSDYGGHKMRWSNTYEFLFTCLLYVVGIGNLVRFPELVYSNGGGAFLIPYIISLLLIGLPIFYLEVSFGQYASLGPISIWKVSPIFKGIGYGVVFSSVIISISYNVTVAWAIYYLFASMQKVLPWSCQDHQNNGCQNISANGIINRNVETTTPYSMLLQSNYSAIKEDLANATSSDVSPSAAKEVVLSRPEFYFYQDFLKVSDGLSSFGYPHWRLCLCLFLAWLIVFVILTQGVKSAGRTALILAPFPYLTLTAFLIQSFVTDSQGATQGVISLVTPQWKYLAKPGVWCEAVGQVFFSLSLMQGGLVTLSSYNKFHHNIYRAAILIPVIDTLTNILITFTVFSVLGVMARDMNVEVFEVIQGSAGVAFISFSEAAAMMPLSQLWSVIFFLMVICLGLGSQYVLIETAVTAILDEYPQKLGKKRLQLVAWCCVALFLLGMPLTCPGGVYLKSIVDKFTSSYAAFFLALFFNIALVWIYGLKRLNRDTKAMLGHGLNIVWRIIWGVITPTFLLIVLMMSLCSYESLNLKMLHIRYEFPSWTDLIGWLIFTVQIIPIFVCATWLYITSPSAPIKEKLKRLSKPSLLWGPALEVNKPDAEKNEADDGENRLNMRRRAFDTTKTIKTGKDIGGLDSIFSGTVGNNILVKMAMNLKGNTSEKDVQKPAKIKYSPSADLLAKRMDSTNGGPIMFQEDGETYMLVPKKKNRPAGVDKSTQTAFIPRQRCSKQKETSFHLGDSFNDEDEREDNCNVQIQINGRTWSQECATGVDNPVIVIESA